MAYALAAAATSFLQAEEVNYALLDAARDPGVRAFILEHAPNAVSLYAGLDEDLADVAPYLVPLTVERIATLSAQGWGNSWGVFLKSEAEIESLRRHFRKFLMVELEDGEEVYFRFYDPRVLRAFLPTCTPDEGLALLGPTSVFLMEADDPAVALKFGQPLDQISPLRFPLIPVAARQTRGNL